MDDETFTAGSMDIDDQPPPVANQELILQQKKAAVEAELCRLEQLPPHSSHVIHRKRVAHKVLELLGKGQERTKEESDELSSLLGSLSL